MTNPFVPIYRQFPVEEPRNLERQLVNFHVQTNIALNNRIISVFDKFVISNGEKWFPASSGDSVRDGKRLVVQISDSTLTVSHNISQINQVTRLWGEFFDGIYWQNLPYVDVTNVTNQIGLKVSPTQIIITKGAGSPPSISNGIVVLEYI